MRILLACNTMGRGGAEIQVRDLAVRLVARGHHVMVLSMLPFEDFEEELRAGGVLTVTLDMTKGKASATGLAKLVGVILRFRPDVVHAHMFAAIVATRLARAALAPMRLLGMPMPVMIGTAHTPFELSPRRYPVYRVTAPFGDMWTNVCREGIETHERFKAVKKGTGVLTMNGIDTSTFKPDAAVRASKRAELGLSDGDFAWLSCGSFRDEQKDFGTLLRAFETMRKQGSRSRLFLAGSGKLFEEKVALAKSLGLSEAVTFLGLRSDVPALMQAVDAFVMASAWEALSLVILEALASGLPSVVTRVGQNEDVVVPGTGEIVPLKDAPALATAMRRVEALSPEQRARMGEAARAHIVSRYDIDVIVRDWESRYEGALAERLAGGARSATAP